VASGFVPLKWLVAAIKIRAARAGIFWASGSFSLEVFIPLYPGASGNWLGVFIRRPEAFQSCWILVSYGCKTVSNIQYAYCIKK
jgi:hypothetical protein